MKVAIVGSRTYPDLRIVGAYVQALPYGSEVVSGGARGVDQVAASYAEMCHFAVCEMRPDYELHGRYDAPKIRNREIVEYADRVVAFWDGMSGGTANAIAWAVALGRPLEVFMVDESGKSVAVA